MFRISRRPFSSTPIGRSVSRFSRNVKQTLFDAVPQHIFTSDKAIDFFVKVGKYVTPAENRAILGATAICLQPAIDWLNPGVNEETRKISVCRTIAKIIAGTLTGFAIRKALIKSVDAFSKLPGSLDKVTGEPVKLTRLNTFFSPVTKVLENSDEYQNYKNGLGNVLALVVMMFTNFLIDAPLTRFLTNKFAKIGGVNNETSK